jgi:hypothetical protein
MSTPLVASRPARTSRVWIVFEPERLPIPERHGGGVPVSGDHWVHPSTRRQALGLGGAQEAIAQVEQLQRADEKYLFGSAEFVGIVKGVVDAARPGG